MAKMRICKKLYSKLLNSIVTSLFPTHTAIGIFSKSIPSPS